MKKNEIGKVSQKIKNTADVPLKFIQENFNVSGSNNFSDIIKNLQIASNTVGTGVQNRQKKEAQRLLKELKGVTILTDFNKYNKFNNLTNAVSQSIAGRLSGNINILGVYNVSDDIIKDINTARNWLSSYKQYEHEFNHINNINNINNVTRAQFDKSLHDQLVILGKSVLGRAVELCPYRTGYLRESAVLIEENNRVTIAFTAPYASYVHENLAIKHPIHTIKSGPNRGMQYDCGGRAKFLEIALQEFFPDRHVWTEIHGFNGVSATITINPLIVEYMHYN